MSGINDSQSQFRVDRWSVEIGIKSSSGAVTLEILKF
jgi:hypothetical protein